MNAQAAVDISRHAARQGDVLVTVVMSTRPYRSRVSQIPMSRPIPSPTSEVSAPLRESSCNFESVSLTGNRIYSTVAHLADEAGHRDRDGHINFPQGLAGCFPVPTRTAARSSSEQRPPWRSRPRSQLDLSSWPRVVLVASRPVSFSSPVHTMIPRAPNSLRVLLASHRGAR